MQIILLFDTATNNASQLVTILEKVLNIEINSKQDSPNIQNKELPINIRSNLRNILFHNFNLSELKNLCQDIDINYESLPDKTLEGTARELIEYCSRHDLLSKLIKQVRDLRPKLNWQTILSNEIDKKSYDTSNLSDTFIMVKIYPSEWPQSTLLAEIQVLPSELQSGLIFDMQTKDQTMNFINKLVEITKVEPPSDPEEVASEVQHIVEGQLIAKLLDNLNLNPNERAFHVLSNAKRGYGTTIDDYIELTRSPNYQGYDKSEILVSINGLRKYKSEIAKIIKEHKMTREDKDNNQSKLALTNIIPSFRDRPRLQLKFEEMKYFDFDGPRRKLWKIDIPTHFARTHYLNKEIPDDIPTPLACAHTILTSKDEKFLILGIRRRSVEFWDNRMSVGFEEQMEPKDMHHEGNVFNTVQRGLFEEMGLSTLQNEVRLLSIGLEASFFSLSFIFYTIINYEPQSIHNSMRHGTTVDREWQPLFIPNEIKYLIKLLTQKTIVPDDLPIMHFGNFVLPSKLEWHGTSRYRLYVHLMRRLGITNFAKVAKIS